MGGTCSELATKKGALRDGVGLWAPRLSAPAGRNGRDADGERSQRCLKKKKAWAVNKTVLVQGRKSNRLLPLRVYNVDVTGLNGARKRPAGEQR